MKREESFEVIKESWSECRLADGTVIRARTIFVKVWREFDEDGRPKVLAEGDPSVSIRTQLVVSATAPEPVPRLTADAGRAH